MAIRIGKLQANTPEIAFCARWRIDAFGDVLENTYAQEEQRLNEFVAGEPGQVGFVAYWDAIPIGTCLLAPKEIEPCHPLTPWLAGLFVLEDYRKRGAGEALVRATENHAQALGHARVFLYTDDAKLFYLRLGWFVQERNEWHGQPFALMAKQLR
jgi:GNAT superfamily N-acetyltransferase